MVTRSPASSRDDDYERAPARPAHRVQRDVEPPWHLVSSPRLRSRLVPARAGRLAAVLQRPLDDDGSVWMDLDWRRPVGLAHPLLRPLGCDTRGRVVLDSGGEVAPGCRLLDRHRHTRRLGTMGFWERGGVRLHRRSTHRVWGERHRSIPRGLRDAFDAAATGAGLVSAASAGCCAACLLRRAQASGGSSGWFGSFDPFGAFGGRVERLERLGLTRGATAPRRISIR